MSNPQVLARHGARTVTTDLRRAIKYVVFSNAEVTLERVARYRPGTTQQELARIIQQGLASVA